MKLRRILQIIIGSSLGLVACSTAVEEPATPLSRDELVEEEVNPLQDPSLAGGIELNTNILKGRVRFTNQNPAILAFLAENHWSSASVSASSTQPSGYNASTSSVTFTNPSEFNFEMLVEAGAGGASGVIYDVRAYRGAHSFPIYRNATVKPKSIQPYPTEVQVESCLGAIQFTLGQDATCATPANTTAISSSHVSVYKRQGQYMGYVPAGFNQRITVHYSFSTTSGTFSNSQQVQVSAGCDQVVPVCIAAQQPPPTVPPPPLPPPNMGALNGPWEIIGEPRVSLRYNYIYGGPRGVNRSYSATTPSAPVSDPSKWWTLTDLPEGTGYTTYSGARLRAGREFTELWTQSIPAGTVVANQTTPITRVVNGQTLYPFVMKPAYFYGSVRLEYASQKPSSLQALFFSGDYDNNHDGIPDRSISDGTYLYARSSGSSITSFPRSFDTNTGMLSSDYEQVLVNPYDQPSTWSQDPLYLRFWSEGLTTSTKPGLYDPLKFRHGTLSIRPAVTSKLMAAGERFRIDHEYCFNEIELNYWTSLGRYFNPRTRVQGGFSGTDAQQRQVSYTLSGDFYGSPAFVGYAPDITKAQSDDWTRLALPQGTYTLRPSASMVNASGQVNEANFAPVSLELGCGQQLKIVPPHTVSIQPMNGCAQSSSATIQGVVLSSGAEVDRLWYRLGNNGPEVELCTNCGVNPTFSFPVQLQACSNEVQVFAFTAGMPRPSVGYQQLTWDDPADGPTCGGAFCVNRPPVARCRSAVAPVDSTCGGAAASVDDGSYDPDAGDTLTCVQTPGTPYTLGSRKVTLTCTDSLGLSSSCEATVTVRDMSPPELTCPASAPQECTTGGDVSAGVTATDNCGAAQGVTCTVAAGVATCRASDAAGNNANCTFPVTVEDDEPPSIACPGAVTAECRDNGATVALSMATATDNCEPPVVTGGQSNFPLGTTAVPYFATDTVGNTAMCITPVTVQDTQVPTLRLVGGRTLELVCGMSATLGVTATDTCQGDLTNQVEAVGLDPTQPGTYQVNYRVTDSSGNTTMAGPRTVTVSNRDELMLVITGDSALDLECKVDTYVDMGATAWDGCANPLNVNKYNSGDDDGDGVPFPTDQAGEAGPGPNTQVEGTYSVKYIGHYGQHPQWCREDNPQHCPTVEAVRTVRVKDTLEPTLNLKGPQQMTHQCGGKWTDPGWAAMDVCYGDISASVATTGSVNGWVLGDYTVRYDVRDPAGHSAHTVTRIVKVVGPCVWR